MVFSSLEFLFVFLPATLVLYFVAPRAWRNALLLATSLAFYVQGSGVLVGLLLASITTNYLLGLWVAGARSDLGRRLGEAGSVVVNLALLGWFKYANFFVDQLHALGAGPSDWARVVLPVGISFYTFQSMSYVFDVARGVSRPLRNPVDFALYVAMFPQLVAGPIVRFHEIASQIRDRPTRVQDVSEGALRFAHGLVKKVVIADSVGAIAEAAFATPPAALGTRGAWLGMLAYTVQLYFDFSGYSDMAIGLGRMFGFRLPENFLRPYSAVSVTDFWRRWHVTLSRWFRDYLYVPLGGSRRSGARTYANLWIVFLLVGAWHGASWTFVLWGAWHGTLLSLERAIGQRHFEARGAAAVARRATTVLAVMLAWPLFRADDLAHAAGYYAALLSFDGAALPVDVVLALTTRNVLALAIACTIFVLPGELHLGQRIEFGDGRELALARAALLLLALPYAALLAMSGTFSPFLYFQF